MENYLKYLYQQGFASATITQYGNSFIIFKKWLTENAVSAESIHYKNLVDFIDHCMMHFINRTNPRSSLNRLLVSVSHYYDYLRLINPELNNPVKSIRVKNPKHNLVHDLIHESDLFGLYDKMDTDGPHQVRNKVILGLLIYQGVSTGDLHRLSVNDLKLRKGAVLIREEGGNRFKKGSTTRELPLAALQIVDLIDYIEEIRPRILAGSYRATAGRKPDNDNIVYRSDQLLLSIGGSANLKSSLLHLFRNLKTINPQVKNATQIRQSVIAGWLNKYDLRKVQYMAGHRYVSSTEYYKQVNLDLLKRKVIEYHPLK